MDFYLSFSHIQTRECGEGTSQSTTSADMLQVSRKRNSRRRKSSRTSGNAISQYLHPKTTHTCTDADTDLILWSVSLWTQVYWDYRHMSTISSRVYRDYVALQGKSLSTDRRKRKYSSWATRVHLAFHFQLFWHRGYSCWFPSLASTPFSLSSTYYMVNARHFLFSFLFPLNHPVTNIVAVFGWSEFLVVLWLLLFCFQLYRQIIALIQMLRNAGKDTAQNSKLRW